MKARDVLFTAGITGAIGAVAFQQWSHQAEMKKAQARMELLGKRIDDEQSHPRVEVRRETVRVEAPVAKAESAAEKPAEEAGNTPPAKPAAAPVDSAEYPLKFDTTFQSERVDPAWAAEARPRLQAGVAEAARAAKATVRSVECHGSMCRMEVVYDDRNQFRPYMDQLNTPGVLPWSGPMYTHLQPQGDRFVATSYLLREGAEMPEMTAED